MDFVTACIFLRSRLKHKIGPTLHIISYTLHMDGWFKTSNIIIQLKNTPSLGNVHKGSKTKDMQLRTTDLRQTRPQQKL